MLVEVMRHVLYRQRVAAARAEQDAARWEAAERNAAIRRILDQDVPDPAGQRADR
jgi:hypothetical protein